MLRRNVFLDLVPNTMYVTDLKHGEYLEKVTYQPEAEGHIEVDVLLVGDYYYSVRTTNLDEGNNHKITLWIHHGKIPM